MQYLHLAPRSIEAGLKILLSTHLEYEGSKEGPFLAGFEVGANGRATALAVDPTRQLVNGPIEQRHRSSTGVSIGHARDVGHRR